jgi:hypothetical protein
LHAHQTQAACAKPQQPDTKPDFSKGSEKQAGAWMLGTSTPESHWHWGVPFGRLFAGEPDEWGTTRPAGDLSTGSKGIPASVEGSLDPRS